MLMLLLLFCVAFCAYAWKWKVKHSSNLELPPALSGALPIIGHTHMFIGDTKHLWNKIIEITKKCTENGGVIHCFMEGSLYYIITDPDDSLTAANACLQKHYAYDFANHWLGCGLVTAPVPIWKNHRKLLNPAFSQPVMNSFFGVFNAQSRQLVNNLSVESGKGSFHHGHYLNYVALETIYQTAFGLTPNFDDEKLNMETYMKSVQDILNIITLRFQRFWLHSDITYYWSKLKKRENELVYELDKMYHAIMQARKAELSEIEKSETKNDTENTGIKYKAFMDLLLELSAEGVLTDQEVMDEVNTIVVAGHDTSANVLMYTLMALGTYPEIQEKVVDELKEVFNSSDRDVDKYDIPKLVYMEAVFKESMRLYPLVPVMIRCVSQDIQLKNYTMRAGSYCLVSVYGSHRHPIWGPDVNEFKPERWLDPNLPVNPNAFGGFGLGKRGCIGRTYGMLSMKTTLAHLLRRYRVKADISQLDLKLDVLLKPISGHEIAIEQR